MPRYKIFYAFERKTDPINDPEGVLQYGQSQLEVETDIAVEEKSEEIKEILRTLGLNNGYLKVGLQRIIAIEADDELEIVSDNSDRFTTD